MKSMKNTTAGLLQPRYIVAFLCFLFLCWLFPYTGDDWTWGGPIGMERLHMLFRDYGGRYLGYLIVMALTRSVWLRAFSMALIYTWTCVLIEKITRHSLAFYVSLLLFACMPKLVLRQAVVWTSGFSNYGFATFFSLVFALYMLSRFRSGGAAEAHPRRAGVLLFLLGLANSLILENLTLCMICMTIVVILYWRKKFRKWNGPFLLHLIAAVIGAALMFSNSAYHNLLNGGDAYSYRKIDLDSIFQQIYENWKIIYAEGFLNNLFLNTVLLAACILCAVLLIRRGRLAAKKVVPPLSVFGAYVAYSFLSLLYITDKRSARLDLAEGLFTLLALFVLFYLVIVLVRAMRNGKPDPAGEPVYFILAILLMIAPLFPVFPIGSRCFYSSYICFILLLCELLCNAVLMLREEGAEPLGMVRAAKQALVVSTVVLFAVYCVLFLSIHKTDVSRLAYIREHVAYGETEISIPHYHHESFLWNATPIPDSKWEERYKLYYGLPDEISLKPVWN